jgi:hypothetical protein
MFLTLFTIKAKLRGLYALIDGVYELKDISVSRAGRA